MNERPSNYNRNNMCDYLFCRLLVESIMSKERKSSTERLTEIKQIVGYLVGDSTSNIDFLITRIEHLEKRIAKLREALEFECGNRCARGINDCNASEALAADDAMEGK